MIGLGLIAMMALGALGVAASSAEAIPPRGIGYAIDFNGDGDCNDSFGVGDGQVPEEFYVGDHPPPCVVQ